MITSHQFKALWQDGGDGLRAFPESAFIGVDVTSETRAFLSEVGLPADAAPFLSFQPPKSGPLESVSEAWGISEAFTRHYVIGFNGSGDPIAITPCGSIVYFNHDSKFSEVYINKDIFSLAESILRCRDLIAKTQKIAGRWAYLDGLIPAALKDDFVAFLEHTDSRALEAGSMWAMEVSSWVA